MIKDKFYKKIKRFRSKYRDKLNDDILHYIDINILPNYLKNDNAHNLEHIYYVLKKSFHIANSIKEEIDYNIVYLLASSHDAEYHIDYATHEEIVANKFLNNPFWEKYFSQDTRNLIYKSLKFHDTKIDRQKLDIYSQILRTADCEVDINVLLNRMYNFRLYYFNQMTINEIIDDSYNYLIILFGEDGLNINKNCFYDKSFERIKQKSKNLIKNKNKFKKVFAKVNKIKLSYWL